MGFWSWMPPLSRDVDRRDLRRIKEDYMATNDDDKGMLQVRDRKGKEEPGLKKREPLFKPLDPKQFRFTLWYFVFMLIGLLLFNTVLRRTKIESIDYSEFKAKIESGEILRVEIGEKYLTGFTLTKAQLDENNQARFSGKPPARTLKTFRTVRTTDPDFIAFL